MSSTGEKKKKYRVNLPKTSFPMKASLTTREPERLRAWQKDGLEKKILETNKSRKQKFILHDGPPYANGHIHIGHALNKTLKDMIVKHKTMQDLNSYYVPGWDCHGLPIEHACLKEMGKRKDEVERVKFRRQARKYAEKFVKIQKEEFKRLGIFGDWENPYLTMNYSYQASIIKAFWEIYEKGFVEQRLKPVPWCFDCETALADAELEYEDKTDTAVFVTFPAAEGDSAYLVWTTTPWTLPANVGLAFHPDLDYVTVETEKGKLTFAKALQPALVEKLGLKQIKEINTQKGSAFEGKEAKHPFLERTSKIIQADYVTATDGTGIVHIAPGHGEDDYVYGFLKNKLDIISPVDEKGRFTPSPLPSPPSGGEGWVRGNDFVTTYPEFKEMHAFKANAKIVELLESKGRLAHHENHPHSYPHCWRCKKPILFRATPQWFMKVDHHDLRKKLTSEIYDKIKFTPDWGKNRIGSMVESRPDWCLSRQRLWGVPIPLAVDKQSGKVHLDEAFKKRALEIIEKDGADAWFWKPIEEFFPDNPELAKKLKLEQDILDVWFDSGVSHQAVLESGHKLGYPTELYLEGSDQHRGWFQTSLISSVALRGQSPFAEVLTHGFVMDGHGKKCLKAKAMWSARKMS